MTRTEIINELKMNGKPIAIYGTGKFGRSLAEYLLKKELTDIIFFEDEEFYCEGKEVLILGGGQERRFDVISYPKMKKKTGYNILCGSLDYRLCEKLKNDFTSSFVAYLDVYPSHVMEKEFVQNNRAKLEQIYNLLEDEESRKVMQQYVIARLTGEVEGLCKLCNSEYLYDWKLLALNTEDVIVDGGAYIGDTVLEIEKYLGTLRPKKICAFEPDEKNYGELINNVGHRDSVICVKSGLWKKNTKVSFENSASVASRISEDADAEIDVVSLDELSSDLAELNEVTVIKMDVEGSELNALKGAEELLKKNMPRLAICIYHRNEDLIDIVDYLRNITSGSKNYKFYLRQHSFSAEETVLYAI